VDILVFPEDGIYGMGFSRQALEPYLEFIPDPKEKWNACNFPDKYPNTEIQRELSCLAKDASLYLVVSKQVKTANFPNGVSNVTTFLIGGVSNCLS
jgi:hypothetical protein